MRSGRVETAVSLPSAPWISAARRSRHRLIQPYFTASMSLIPVSWFEIGHVKSLQNTTDGIPLHVKRLCVIERMRGTSEGLKTHAYRNSFANLLGGLDRPLPGNDSPNSNGA
jgi:hypothetical protein